MEDPHYAGAREVFRAVGARILPVPLDGAGLRTDRLPAVARLAYVTPSHQFPTGAVLPLTRRLDLLSWAARKTITAASIATRAGPSRPCRPSTTPAGSSTPAVSRVSLFPSLRMGYLVAPPALAPALAQAKWISDRHTSLLQQAALANFLREGHLDRAVARHFGGTVEVPGAQPGVHVMLRFPGLPARLSRQWIDAALRHGVRAGGVSHYYLNPPECCE